ncbi:hypothetical protein VNO77_27431 [Canavalia gladiata]|uniref:Uncharacterized protein n=1 Tax=Canavalia gladiata TaxID=3824 RepID=A0AAN9Q731_CANGL
MFKHSTPLTFLRSNLGIRRHPSFHNMPKASVYNPGPQSTLLESSKTNISASELQNLGIDAPFSGINCLQWAKLIENASASEPNTDSAALTAVKNRQGAYQIQTSKERVLNRIKQRKNEANFTAQEKGVESATSDKVEVQSLNKEIEKLHQFCDIITSSSSIAHSALHSSSAFAQPLEIVSASTFIFCNFNLFLHLFSFVYLYISLSSLSTFVVNALLTSNLLFASLFWTEKWLLTLMLVQVLLLLLATLLLVVALELLYVCRLLPQPSVHHTTGANLSVNSSFHSGGRQPCSHFGRPVAQSHNLKLFIPTDDHQGLLNKLEYLYINHLVVDVEVEKVDGVVEAISAALGVN